MSDLSVLENFIFLNFAETYLKKMNLKDVDLGNFWRNKARNLYFHEFANFLIPTHHIFLQRGFIWWFKNSMNFLEIDIFSMNYEKCTYEISKINISDPKRPNTNIFAEYSRLNTFSQPNISFVPCLSIDLRRAAGDKTLGIWFSHDEFY